jgi:hypothetical protein
VSAPDILVQVHIPRCAGTSVRIWLHDAALEGAISGYRSLYPDYVFGRHEVWPSADDPRLAAASTHNIRYFTPTVAGRRVHYFTLLRDPRAQALSAVRYVQQERDAFGVPRAVRNTSYDIAKWLLEGSFGEPFENAQTNHIALHAWCDASGRRLLPDRYISWSAADRAAYERERLEFAKSLLADFIVVGTVERLPESLGMLRARSARYGINLLPVERLTRANASDVPPDDDAAWIDNDPLGARLLESLTVDDQLHAHARRGLEAVLGPPSSPAG